MKSLLNLSKRQFSVQLEKHKQQLAKAMTQAVADIKRANAEFAYHDRRAKASNFYNAINKMTKVSISDEDINYLPASKRKAIYYTPLKQSDYQLLHYFSPETAKLIVKGGRAALYWEVSN